MGHGRIVHVISHTHWDREWYMPYEKHRVRLVALMDTLLEVLARDGEFRSFHLDGQTIVLDDYLEVRPERRELIERYVTEGRLLTGPWYILQDEFLTSGEANVRNLLTGHRDAARYGRVTKIGYFPDSFGNMGQAPQLMRQAGIDTAVFGRGVKPTGFNNEVADSEGYESPFSELVWQSPDGSEVLGILFANWYHNGMEIPADPDEANRYWRQKLADAERYASTPHLLLMNGCDHQPVQTDLTAALTVARSLFPDTTFLHSDFPAYAEALLRTPREDLSVIRGELRSQRTDGWGTLVNTASARVYIKQANQECQTLLENVTEPLAALAAHQGAPYPHHLLDLSWKTLMQNHPHDSICGCSVDEVHREMMARFAKSRHTAEALAETSARALADAVNTSAFGAFAGAKPFVVFNTSGRSRSGTVEIELELARRPLAYDDGGAARAELSLMSAEGHVIDSSGKRADCRVQDLGVRFGYELPDDRFRQPYWARAVRISVRVRDIPALGHEAFAWVPSRREQAAEAASLLTDWRTMENGHLRVTVEDNGTITLLDKATGRTYSGLCEYEDVGDIGNEYMFKQPEGDRALRTGGLKAAVAAVEDTPSRAVISIRHDWSVPVSADDRLRLERDSMVPFRKRKAQRAAEHVPLALETRVTLEKDAKSLQVSVSFDNRAADHRLRVLLPADIETGVHYADSIFEIAERDTVPAPEWTNPSNCQHMSAFAAVDNAAEGLMAAAKGLNEYEVLRDGRNTIALTLLRAVGELGDWGVFPTPEAQCPGRHTMEFAILPYGGSAGRVDAASQAYQYLVPWTVRQTGVHDGGLPPRHAALEWEGDGLALTAVKRNEDTDDLILRWVNLSGEGTSLTVRLASSCGEWYESNVLEEAVRPITVQPEGTVRVVVGPAQIVTLGCRGERK